MKYLLIGVIIISCMMMVTPSISAIQYRDAVETNKAKILETLDNGFIDIAVLLTIINVILARLLNGFPLTIRSAIYTVEVIFYIISLLKVVKDEYNSGMTLPRYKAYQGYFASLFSIFNVIFIKMLPDATPKMKVILTQIFFFASFLLAQYLGNVLYVMLGRPGIS